jgi:hypothetical protein
MTLNELQDKIWLHVGSRPPKDIEDIFASVPGAFLAAPDMTSRMREVAASSLPTALAHTGKPEEPSLFSVHETWLHRQSDSAVLTSHPYFIRLEAGRLVGLAAAIQETNAFLDSAQRSGLRKPSLAMIAIDARILKTNRLRQQLIQALLTVNGSVGLMLGGNDRDPLESVQIVEGLVRLLDTLPSTVLLRADHAALGAFGFGAEGGSIGLNPGSRHFMPWGSSGYADLEDPSPRVYWPLVQSWHKGSLFQQIGPRPMLDCFCLTCQGRSLVRFHSPATEAEAAAHSVHCWQAIAQELAAADNRSERWISICKGAYENLDALADDHDLLLFEPSKQLKAWLRFAGVPAS